MIKYVGRINRQAVNALYGQSRAGIVIYQPAKNHFEAQPIKLFEFMAAGLPVIASDFPLWQKIVEENDCGICVNPTDAASVKNACIKLLSNPDRGQEMGKNGRKAVLEKYNWANEEKKLLALYETL
ncbi:MAG: glycosyltransferase family 4 protein [Selenomonas ruminantium]|jgi:glycosyltransferase involved in cell wall biosynthesis|uniref:Glycosyltransferase family 4 protein n=1 Tax=Selenomonas ruminantium TaxID=971 RepID=A0A927ZYC4_SELRU|nr:glycosyltransferase [Selenomonas ruminantium]MBE6084388.1 glycosyltransferase family 4 protein [Selenomonas ruminantium]